MTLFIIKVFTIMSIVIILIKKALILIDQYMYKIYISNRRPTTCFYIDNVLEDRPNILNVYGYQKLVMSYFLGSGLRVKVKLINDEYYTGYIIGFTKGSNFAMYTDDNEIMYSNSKYISGLYIFDECYQDCRNFNIRDIYPYDSTTILCEIIHKKEKNDRGPYLIVRGER